jgi:NADPH:quinone reductase-like Zn-dependent oxidoreductase/malonyl CoA-acyl carrier protein transacylase
LTYDTEKLGDEKSINQPDFSQPLCTILQIALVQLLRSFGISPTVVIGHSSGEIAAAYAVGALSHESACKVAYFRGQVVSELALSQQGSMMVVNLEPENLRLWLDKLGIEADSIAIASFNSSTNITLSGPATAMDNLKLMLDQHGIFAHKLNTGVAYHSKAMNAVQRDYLDLVGFIEKSSTPKQKQPVIFISTVSGGVIAAETLADPQYWVNNLVSPVHFTQAMQCLAGGVKPISLPLGIDCISDIIEVGPSGALKRSIMDNIINSATTLRYHSSLSRYRRPIESIMTLAGSLFTYGHSVSLLKVNCQVQGKTWPLTDCPLYPFNHNQRYWQESRLSKDFRERKSSSAYMLGRRAQDWNSLQPRWRNWLSIETVPWLQHHMVSDTTVCPGTALLVMAIEAAKEIAVENTKSRTISGFLVKDAQFLAPITIAEAAQNAIEVELHLRPVRVAHEKEVFWSDFYVFSYSSGRWTECFRCRVQVQYTQTIVNPVDGGRNLETEHKYSKDCVDTTQIMPGRSFKSRDFYEFWRDCGVSYGKTFQLLDSIVWDGGPRSWAQINLPKAQEAYDVLDSPVHPVVLDACGHLAFLQISKGLTGLQEAMVMHSIASVWFSAQIWDHKTTTLQLRSEIQSNQQSSKVEGSVFVMADNNIPLAHMRGLTFSEVSQRLTKDQSAASSNDLLYNVSWKPQLSSLNAEQRQNLFFSNPDANDEILPIQIHQKFDFALRMAVRRAVQGLSNKDLQSAPLYMTHYLSSLKYLYSRGEHDSDEMDDKMLEPLLKQCETDFPQWRMLTAVARVLRSILLGKTNPLELLFSNHLVKQLYTDLYDRHMTDNRFRYLLDLISHERPGLKILEVGAGTGGFTRHILATLAQIEQQTGQTRFSEYTYTDISPSFFEAAQTEFHQHQSRMLYKTLDITKNPQLQGFNPESYDLIVAGSVLHATPDLELTLKNIRSLLATNSYLIGQEIVHPQNIMANVGFGCLEGWWLSKENWRKYSPLLTEKQWHASLRQSGYFSGIDINLRDYASPICHFSSIFLSTAINKHEEELNSYTIEGPDAQQDLTILLDTNVRAQSLLARSISDRYPRSNILSLGELYKQEQKLGTGVVICLLEIDKSYLAFLSEEEFLILQQILRSTNKLLWVVQLPNIDGTLDPHSAISVGLLRSLRSENSEKKLVSLVVESGSTTGNEDIYVLQILESSFFNTSFSSAEVEYRVRNGCIEIARLKQELQLDDERLSRIYPRPEEGPWQSTEQHISPLTIQIGTPGMLDTLRVTEDLSYLEDLSDEDVEIEAVAWPVSFRDVFIALGRLPETLGFECAGIVKRVGTKVSHLFKRGDRVVMAYPGSMRSHPRAPGNAVLKISEHISFHEAVSVLNPLITAYHCLVDIANLQRGEKILIHSAAGSTGQMAVELALSLGAEVFVTVGSDDKKQLMIEHFGIHEERIFYSRDDSFVDALRNITGSVDVILNSLSGNLLHASWECIAPYGRFIEIGKMDIASNSSLPMKFFARNVTFAAVDIHHLALSATSSMRVLFEKAISLVESGQIRPPTPLHVYPISKIERAFRFMQSGRNTGRIIISSEGDNGTVEVKKVVSVHVSGNANITIETGFAKKQLAL